MISKPPTLLPGDTIGIICPCSKAEREKYFRYIHGLNRLGFSVKEGKNLYKTTYGYAASEQERADDFNDMIRDTEVKMLLFGGGPVGNELLPYIDFEAIKNHPKLICSYSNGTTLLNTIYAQTGLTVYYGQFPGVFADISSYDAHQFQVHFAEHSAKLFQKNSEWTCLRPGTCEGILIGGYSALSALLLGNPYFSFDKDKDYILFLENHEDFCVPGEISTHLAHIEQHAFMRNVKGLLFGHYSEKPNIELSECLRRFGERNQIPVAKCDDFGHGRNHAILPIGTYARLDADAKTLFLMNA